jgi:two-component system, NtrC family, sensor kinase
MMFLQAAALPPPGVPDNRLLFVVSVVVVASVVIFTAGVVVTLLRRGDRRRAEEEKLAAIGTATARILHQIKNPLQTIVLHADLLQNEKIVADVEQRGEVAEAIVGESQRLVAMLEELSVYASGSQRGLSRQAVALHELVGYVAGHEARDPDGPGLRVEVGPLERSTVFADAYYLRQALDNLVRNAREATESQADGRLSVSLVREGGEAVVRVADNGPGIPAEAMARIFEPFVSTKGKGMGLGLAICRDIVDAHAGRLEVESAEGVGTTFTLRLPLHSEAPSAPPRGDVVVAEEGAGAPWK